MKKTAFILVAAAALALVLSGCTAPAAAPTAAPTEVVVEATATPAA